ncbi:hypothetical protein RvY_14407-2 [Ramazzottius varieornatus]|uniref:Uncharacterized protein n=1 Tax=Ramazzottius varieornatus TaxID=947166 RepID=A0A1D1VR95_RAMVA|nr:hypothetical protein RvY_14407-2 [Ramazzottius varieornatus]
MDHSDQQLEDVETFGAETSISLVPPDDYEPDKEQDTSDSWDASFGLAFDTRDSDRLDDLAGLATANFALPGDRLGFGWKEGLKVAQHGLGRRSPSRERSRSPDEAETSFSRDVHSPAALAESLDFTAKSHVDSLDNPSVILSSDFTHEISPIVNGPNSHKKTALKDVIATDGLDFSITSVEQEGKILSRIAELRKVGKWEDSRIPKCVVAPPFSKGIVNFTKEVTWVATLIAREKKQKMIMAKKIAYAVKRWHEKREEQKRKQEREERLRMRKVAKHIGSLVMAWWQELGKVAQLKQREEIEIQKKKIRDLHLRHLMDQTEEFSSRMAQGLSRTSTQLAIEDSAEPVEEELDPQDKEFEVEEDSEAVDEEDTISDEEAQEGEQQQSEDALMEEADLPIEELLKRYSGYEETVLAAAEAPSVNKRRRTMSRNPDFEYEIEKKKKRDDDLSVLVQPSNGEEPSMSRTENASFDDKVKKREEAMEKLKPKGNSLSSTEVVTKVPFLLRGSLREYQHVGLDWLVSLYHNQMNGILADEMGLGKTIQTIAFIAHLASAENNWGPHLVIVPTSVILNWELEFKRWCPGLIIKTYYGSRKQRLDLRTGWTKPDAFHVCITSYKVATQDYSSFRRMRWQYLILDEAQAIKNYKSQRWTRIAEFPSHRRLLLTGTPMQNSLEEVWALLHFLAPELFENLNMFQQLFSNPMTAMSEGKKPQDNAIVKQLHTVLRPFILRRMKAEVETQLPKKFEHVVQCRLSKRQRNLYDDYMSRTKTKETLATGNYLSVINILMQLRKVCNHPNLFEERPVLSPMVVAPIPIKLPGLIFDVLNSTRDPPYMKEVSTTIRLPFWHSPSGLFSTDSSTLLSLVPPDDKLAPLREEGKEIAPAEMSYPQDFPAVMNSIELTMTDMMAGTPFVRDDERLCTDLCTHSPAPPVKAFSTVATVHTGRVKRSLKNGTGPRTPMRNGTKKLRSNVVEVNPEAPVRISSKRFTDDVVPLLLKQQREDHYDVFVASNRRKCELKPLILEDVLNFVKLKNGGKGDRRTPLDVAETGYGQCLEAQKEVLQEGPFRKGYSALEDMTEMGASVGTCLRRRDVSFWLESMSLAYAPVMTSPPILRVSNMPRRVLEKMDFLEKQLMPIVKHVSEVLHPVQRLRVLKFPETRLIQYDCGKLQALDDLLKGLFAGSHRVLIFTQMTKVLDILEIFLTYHGYKYLRLDGTTGVEMRQTLMDRFNRDKRYFVFILSTRSGGVGVNLTGADTVVFYDSDWNPTMDAQAQDRCHRIGQTRDVHIYRLISEYTVEENIHMKASQKKYLGQLAIEQGDFTTAVLKKENFKDIFGLKEGDLPATSTEEKSSHEASLEVVNEEAAIEAAIAEAEDADDADAARKAKAEAKVEEEEEDDDDDQPRFKAIQKLLAPIQCYGVQYMESHVLDQDVMEELEQTREEVERKKKEWELNRLEIAKAEKIRAAEEVCEPYVVTKTLMDPKVDKRNLRPSSSRRKAAVSPSPAAVAPQLLPQTPQSEPQTSSRGRSRRVSTGSQSTPNSSQSLPSTSGGKEKAIPKKKKDDDPEFKLPLPVTPRMSNGKTRKVSTKETTPSTLASASSRPQRTTRSRGKRE